MTLRTPGRLRAVGPRIGRLAVRPGGRLAVGAERSSTGTSTDRTPGRPADGRAPRLPDLGDGLFLLAGADDRHQYLAAGDLDLADQVDLHDVHLGAGHLDLAQGGQDGLVVDGSGSCAILKTSHPARRAGTGRDCSPHDVKRTIDHGQGRQLCRGFPRGRRPGRPGRVVRAGDLPASSPADPGRPLPPRRRPPRRCGRADRGPGAPKVRNCRSGRPVRPVSSATSRCDGRLDVLAVLDEPSGQGPLAGEGIMPALDQKDSRERRTVPP